MGNLWPKKEEERAATDSRRQKGQGPGRAVQQLEVNPFVFKKASSMYFDEDGDLAHEFYQEERVVSKSGVVRWHMKRIFNNLTPQGEVELPFPRLHVDLPIVLVDTSTCPELSVALSGQQDV